MCVNFFMTQYVHSHAELLEGNIQDNTLRQWLRLAFAVADTAFKYIIKSKQLSTASLQVKYINNKYEINFNIEIDP